MQQIVHRRTAAKQRNTQRMREEETNGKRKRGPKKEGLGEIIVGSARKKKRNRER